MQLMYFRKEVWSPDDFLNRYIDGLRWIWSTPSLIAILLFISVSMTVASHRLQEIIIQGQALLSSLGFGAFLLFIIFSLVVVAIHELGHAFTLKHYGGVVPWFGVMFMMGMPLAYTDTTDSYCLSRFKRVQVVGAGIVVQLILAGLGFWTWTLTVPGTWLQIGGYLLMTASLTTVAINCFPLAKFDGYYLMMAILKINDMRQKAFEHYGDILKLRPSKYTGREALILTLYAPLAFLYMWFIFGYILLSISSLLFNRFPILTLVLLSLYIIYLIMPDTNLERS